MDEIQERRGLGRPPKYVTETQATPTQEATASVDAPRRPRKNNPFGTIQAKFGWEERPGFKRYLFNDTAGRIQTAIEGGWTHVQNTEGKKVKWTVGPAEGGGPLEGYLMEIPQEWYDEDMAAQQKVIDDREALIKRGQADRQEGDGRYIPSQGIKIEHGK